LRAGELSLKIAGFLYKQILCFGSLGAQMWFAPGGQYQWYRL
jgi:hypothetical protein